MTLEKGKSGLKWILSGRDTTQSSYALYVSTIHEWLSDLLPGFFNPMLNPVVRLPRLLFKFTFSIRDSIRVRKAIWIYLYPCPIRYWQYRPNGANGSGVSNQRSEAIYLGLCKLKCEILKEAKNDRKWHFLV